MVGAEVEKQLKNIPKNHKTPFPVYIWIVKKKHLQMQKTDLGLP